MKKLIISAIAVLLPAFGISQSIFDKFEDSDKIGTVIINNQMLKLVATMAAAGEPDEEAQEFMDLAKSVKGIKVFVSEDKGASEEMASTVKQYVRKASLEEMMRIKDEDTNVRFYVKNGKKDTHVEELVMLVSGIDGKHKKHKGPDFETVLLTMTGDIDLEKVGMLTKKMNLPQELEKASEKGE